MLCGGDHDTAKVMHLERYGLDVGCDASFVLLRVRIRLRRFACGPHG